MHNKGERGWLNVKWSKGKICRRHGTAGRGKQASTLGTRLDKWMWKNGQLKARRDVTIGRGKRSSLDRTMGRGK